jgi:hypothetical protein
MDALNELDGAPRSLAVPVYALAPGGEPAVPSGLILVRFREEIAANSRSTNLEAVGFVIRRVLSYAPHAAWVESRSSDIAAALAGIHRLELLPDIQNVEPQMLMAAMPKN